MLSVKLMPLLPLADSDIVATVKALRKDVDELQLVAEVVPAHTADLAGLKARADEQLAAVERLRAEADSRREQGDAAAAALAALSQKFAAVSDDLGKRLGDMEEHVEQVAGAAGEAAQEAEVRAAALAEAMLLLKRLKGGLELQLARPAAAADAAPAAAGDSAAAAAASAAEAPETATDNQAEEEQAQDQEANAAREESGLHGASRDVLVSLLAQVRAVDDEAAHKMEEVD